MASLYKSYLSEKISIRADEPRHHLRTRYVATEYLVQSIRGDSLKLCSGKLVARVLDYILTWSHLCREVGPVDQNQLFFRTHKRRLPTS